MADQLRKWLPLLISATLGAIVAAAIVSYLTLSGLTQGLFVTVGAIAGFVFRWFLVERRLQLEHEYRVFEEQTKTVHGYVVLYYLPFLFRVQYLVQTLRNEPLSDEECIHAVAQLYSMDRKWMDEVPVLLLKDRVGENVIRSIEIWCLNAVSQPLSKEDKGELIKQTKLDELYVDWVNKVKPGGSLYGIFSQKFQPWLLQVNREELVRWLHTLIRLFLFEINMCYASWYGKSPTKVTAGTEGIDTGLVRTCLQNLVLSGEIDKNDQKQFLNKLGIKP